VGIPLLILLGSCSGSSPRFRSEDRETPSVVQEEDEFRFASKIREEESREDDRKVDLATFRKRADRSAAGRYSNKTPDGINRDALLIEVVSMLGVPYRYGGADSHGIDCSGFTQRVYQKSLNMSLPRRARDQYASGNVIPDQEIQFGDLIFFNTTGSGPSHVGIYLEDDLFAHASVTYGVTISSLESSYYKNRYLGIRRVVRDENR
jgi:cell wall-associated NlpC family hydrolase